MAPAAGGGDGLRQAGFVGFIPVRNLEAARSFYVDVLGLVLQHRDQFAVTVNVGGATLRLTEVADLHPQTFTVAGWEVPDVDSTVAALMAAGVHLKHYEGLDQDPRGVWTAPGGDRVAWFSDPDGNTLSLTGRADR